MPLFPLLITAAGLTIIGFCAGRLVDLDKKGKVLDLMDGMYTSKSNDWWEGALWVFKNLR